MCNRVSGQTEASVYWWRRELKAGGVAGGEDQGGEGWGWGGVVAGGGYSARGYCEIGNGKQGSL